LHKILVTICARGGSKGVKGKNVRILDGSPLIHHTIRQSLEWNKADRVVVSTDSREIRKIAEASGAGVPFIRPSALATDSAAKIPVIRHALVESEKLYGERYDIIVDLDPTSPVRTTDDLDNALDLFQMEKPKTLFSVVQSYKNPYFNMVELDHHGKAHLSKRSTQSILRRQDAPMVYDMNASIYIFERGYLMNENNSSVFSDQSIIYEMSQFSAVDIDREIDFKFIELLIREGLVEL